MDWFTWLSKTSLDPSLVYEYGLIFSHNELQEEDIAYFNHEFLQCMGISIAKHRLEVLKLAKRETSHSLNLKHPISKLVLVLKKTKKSLANYIARFSSHKGGDNRAIIVFSNNNKKKKIRSGALSYSSRWRKAMMINKDKRLVVMHGGNYTNQDQLIITNGDYFGDNPMVLSTPIQHYYEHNHNNDEKVFIDNEYWAPTLEDIRWDAMFHDLKPT